MRDKLYNIPLIDMNERITNECGVNAAYIIRSQSFISSLEDILDILLNTPGGNSD